MLQGAWCWWRETFITPGGTARLSDKLHNRWRQSFFVISIALRSCCQGLGTFIVLEICCKTGHDAKGAGLHCTSTSQPEADSNSSATSLLCHSWPLHVMEKGKTARDDQWWVLEEAGGHTWEKGHNEADQKCRVMLEVNDPLTKGPLRGIDDWWWGRKGGSCSCFLGGWSWGWDCCKIAGRVYGWGSCVLGTAISTLDVKSCNWWHSHVTQLIASSKSRLELCHDSLNACRIL